MSLEQLVSGAECAVGANPISQVLKHTEGDRSVQRERIAGPSSSRLQHLPASSLIQPRSDDLALARQFFQANAPAVMHGPAAAPQLTRPYMPSSELITRAGMGTSSPAAATFDMESAWSQSNTQAMMQIMQAQGQKWSAEFRSVGPNLHAPTAINQMQLHPQQQELSSPQYMSSQQFHSQQMSMPMYSMGIQQSFNPMQAQSKGKGKMSDQDFEAAFAQMAASMAPQTAKADELHDVNNVANTLSNLELSEIADSNQEMGTDFETYWNELQKSSIPPAQEDMAKWEAEFNQLMQSQREDYDYTGAMQSAWENGMGDVEDTLYDGSPSLTFNDEGIPMLGEYVFETNNEYLLERNGESRLDRAKALLSMNGSLTEAALLLEAAIQQGELGKGGYEAWILLGETRSMDEREDAAMRALQEGVQKATEAGANGEGMLSLAISYTNESYDKAAHTILMRWLLARFPEFSPPPETTDSLKRTPWDSYQRVTDAFLSIAVQQHSQGVVDADVQAGLGVLFYSNRDYERARDCFESGLTVRPQDYLLWNRLGSSLSNGSKPEEALGAYREALRLRPTYTRAIYNVGVACLNIGANKEAVEHFLSALVLQDSTDGEKSEQIWFTLRRALGAMNRDDLADKAHAGSSVEAFRSEGFDF